MVGAAPTYFTFDIDSIDPAFAPGTGTPEIGGFTSREALQLVRGFRHLNLVGADMVEVSPPLDQTGNTALVGASIAFELLCLLAESRSQQGDGTDRRLNVVSVLRRRLAQALLRRTRDAQALLVVQVVGHDIRPKAVLAEVRHGAGADRLARDGLRSLQAAGRLAFGDERPRFGSWIGPSELQQSVEQSEQHDLMQKVDRQAMPSRPDDRSRPFPSRTKSARLPILQREPRENHAEQHHGEPREDRHIIVGHGLEACQDQASRATGRRERDAVKSQGAASTKAATAIVAATGARRKGSASTLESAMQCRMPKKMKLSGNANQVATVTSRAAPPTMARRRMNARQRISCPWARTRPMPDRNRNEPAMMRANHRHAGIATTLVSISCRKLRSQPEMVNDHRQDREAAGQVDRHPIGCARWQGRAMASCPRCDPSQDEMA